MKFILGLAAAFAAGVIADRYLSDRPIINLTFDPKIKVNVQNAYLKDPR